MRRLFTFGCSFTQYNWPTWADIIGQSYDYYENWGRCGGGNYLISSRIVECDHIHKLTKDDTVLVMFTSVPRIDTYNGSWQARGNVLNIDWHKCERMWLDRNWSIEQAYYTSWVAIKSAKVYLDKIGCDYKFLKAFNLNTSEIAGDPMFPDDPNFNHKIHAGEYDLFYSEFNKDMNKHFDINISMTEWRDSFVDYSNDTWRQVYPNCYTFAVGYSKGKPMTDYHPTIRQHELWCREYLPEYYVNHINVDEMESMLKFDSIYHNRPERFNIHINNCSAYLSGNL
jgi:hypothetical protein